MLAESRRMKLKPDSDGYIDALWACIVGGWWQQSLTFLNDLQHVKLEPSSFLHNAAMPACDVGEQGQRALCLLGELHQSHLELDVQRCS